MLGSSRIRIIKTIYIVKILIRVLENLDLEVGPRYSSIYTPTRQADVGYEVTRSGDKVC